MTCGSPDLVTFLEVAKSSGQRLATLDLPTSEKLANQGRTKPRHLKALCNLTTQLGCFVPRNDGVLYVPDLPTFQKLVNLK